MKLWEEPQVDGAVRFQVLGLPVAQGSKKTVPAGERWVAVDTNESRLKPWRNDIGVVARTAMAGLPPFPGPVLLRAVFTFPRPKTHYGTGRNAGQVKPNAPGWKPTAPDLDKLVRALGDALTGIVFRDDSQIVDLQVSKIWGDLYPGVLVEVRPLS